MLYVQLGLAALATAELGALIALGRAAQRSGRCGAAAHLRGSAQPGSGGAAGHPLD